MAEKDIQQQGLDPEEVEELAAEELPDREVMSVINPGLDGMPSVHIEPELP